MITTTVKCLIFEQIFQQGWQTADFDDFRSHIRSHRQHFYHPQGTVSAVIWATCSVSKFAFSICSRSCVVKLPHMLSSFTLSSVLVPRGHHTVFPFNLFYNWADDTIGLFLFIVLLVFITTMLFYHSNTNTLHSLSCGYCKETPSILYINE